MSYANKAFTVTALGLVLGCSAPVFANQHYKNAKPRLTRASRTAAKARQKKVDDVKVGETSANPIRYFKTVKKRAGGSVVFNNYGTSSKIGRVFFGVGGYVNDLFGGDRLSIFGGSPLKSPFDNVFSWGVRYRKVLNARGLTMELGHSFTKADAGFVADPPQTQPGGNVTLSSFRAETDGSSSTVSLTQPWVLRGGEELSSRLDLNYFDGNNELFPAAGQALQNRSKVSIKLPTVSLATNYEKRFNKGSVRVQVRFTKGGDMILDARRTTQANAEANVIKTFGAVNLNFFVVNLGLGSSVRLTNRLDFLTSADIQWNPDGKTLPGVSKIAINSGGFVGQSLSADEGVVGKIGLGYRFRMGALPVRDLRARVFTSRGVLRNDGSLPVAERRISVGDVGLGLDMVLPIRGFQSSPTVGLVWTKVYTDTAQEKGGRFLFQVGAKF